ncbi:MAG: hypothetical protein D6730_03915 [Bacteroidetes bacterium]|nr:MAG: hypothetical protein D6730_03915 [Bacteroidota bacterium]
MKTVERTLLSISGLAGIAAFFLPFFRAGRFFSDIALSGFSFVQAGLDAGGVGAYPAQKQAFMTFLESWQQASMLGMLKYAALAFVWLGPVFFVLYSLGHFFRGLAGRHYKRGIFFALLYMGAGYLVFRFLGPEMGLEYGFFDAVGPGFWVGFTAIIVAAFSAFFEKSPA